MFVKSQQIFSSLSSNIASNRLVAQVVSGKIAHFQRYETIGDIADGLSSNPRRSVRGLTPKKTFRSDTYLFLEIMNLDGCFQK